MEGEEEGRNEKDERNEEKGRKWQERVKVLRRMDEEISTLRERNNRKCWTIHYIYL